MTFLEEENNTIIFSCQNGILIKLNTIHFYIEKIITFPSYFPKTKKEMVGIFQ